VGLGNPGPEYDGTRHNVGFAVVTEIADARSARFHDEVTANRPFEVAEIRSADAHRVLLVKPRSFMNASGVVVAEIVQRFEIPLEKIFIILDDFNLSLGALRLRAGGSDGGHNGLASIIEHLSAENFGRMRCGIGPVAGSLAKEEHVDFVLSRFHSEELQTVREMTSRAAAAALCFVDEGMEIAMTRFNSVNT
jgi:PTH1 family peptidyl-tRNA hydrolase